MAINPITGREEESPVTTDLNGNPSTGFSPLKWTSPITATEFRDPITATEFSTTPEGSESTIITSTPATVKAKRATKEDPVVSWDEIEETPFQTATRPEGWILSGLTKEDILNMEEWENKTKIIKAIKERRDFEGITGERDSILWGLGFTTIKDAADSPTTISDEVIRDTANQILEGKIDWLRKGARDEEISSFLKSQGVSDAEIKATLNARDAQLKEERIRGDRATIVERKEQEIEQRIAQESDDIREQVQRSQNLLQRQRSLRGVGRSSMTEQDMLDLQKKGDQMIATATAKANLELSLFKAQQEGAESEAIASIQEALSAQTARLNEQILDQAALENQLVATGELESDQAFESLMGSLKLTGEDIWAVDKDASKLLGFVSDKNGNAILVNGERVPTGGNTAAQAETIGNFAESIMRWDSSLTTVPSELRGNVINALAAKREAKWVLSATQSAQSQSLSKKIFGNTKEAGVKAIQALMLEGLSPEEISNQLNDAWFSEKYQGAMRSAIFNASKWLTSEWKEDVREEFRRLLDDGDETRARELMLLSALESSWADVQKKVEWRRTLINSLTSIREELANYVEAWWDTSLLTGKMENIMNKVWKTWDPKLANIANKISISVQEYRNAMSGAAFSESESKEYEKIFPSTDKSIELNAVKANSIIEKFSESTEAFYSWRIWMSNYNEIFPNGVMWTLHGEVEVPTSEWGIESTTFQIDEQESSDLDNIFWPEKETTTTVETETFKPTSSWFQFDASGLDSADQTATPKGIPTTGFSEKVDIARTWTNVAKDTNNPWNITADSIPAWNTKEGYGKAIGATGTYLSPNGREYFIFPDVTAWSWALQRDIQAKISWNSKNIKPSDTLERFQRVYVWEVSPWYLSVLERITWKNRGTQIKDIDAKLLTEAVMEAEWFTN